MKAEHFFKTMYMIRSFEEKCLELFSKGHINGTIHTCIGQESIAVGVGASIDLKKDIVFSNHRGHGHFIATYGQNKIFELFSEIMGKSTGICHGIGGSQHIHYKNFYSNGIQGGIAPVLVGMTLAETIKNTGAVGLVFLGDGTMGEGVVYESLNIASKWSLPVIFCIENNLYAQTTPVADAHAGNLSERGKAFGIKTYYDTSNDVFSINQTAREAFSFVRTKKVPVILYTETYRLVPHSKGDDFRDKTELELMRKEDPLLKLESNLEPKIVQNTKNYIDKIIDEASIAALST